MSRGYLGPCPKVLIENKTKILFKSPVIPSLSSKLSRWKERMWVVLSITVPDGGSATHTTTEGRGVDGGRSTDSKYLSCIPLFLFLLKRKICKILFPYKIGLTAKGGDKVLTRSPCTSIGPQPFIRDGICMYKAVTQENYWDTLLIIVEIKCTCFLSF